MTRHRVRQDKRPDATRVRIPGDSKIHSADAVRKDVMLFSQKIVENQTSI
jgi:hypothetical protein